MKIKTNNVPRPLVCWHDLPEDVQSDFDYVEGEDRHSLRFFAYKGCWYDSHEFEVTRNYQSLRDLRWDGVQTDSYFSGVVIRYVNDYEMVVAGLMLS